MRGLSTDAAGHSRGGSLAGHYSSTFERVTSVETGQVGPHGPKMAPERPQIGPRWAQTGSGWAKMVSLETPLAVHGEGQKHARRGASS